MTSISYYDGGVVLPRGAGAAEWVHARFGRAVEIVQSLPRTGPIQTNYDDKLLLYSVYKQATEGDIKVPRPGILDVLGKAKWDAWNKKKGLSPEGAERLYVQGLLKILKGYSNRPQAIELIRELETFSLDRRGMAMSGSIAQSARSSSSTSTEGEDPRHRRQPQASSSRPRAAPAPTPQSNRGRAPPQPSSHRHHAGPPPPASITSASVAPSLPGYGPPRTRADSPHRPEDLSDEDDYSSSSDEGRRPRQYYDHPPASSQGGSVLGVPAGYQRAPLTPQQYAGSSHGGLQPASNMIQSSQRMLSPGLAPSPQFHTLAQQPLHPHMFLPQHPPPSASMLHKAAGIARPASPGPSMGGSQQLAMAYPPGVQIQMPMRPPSTQSTVNTVAAAAVCLPTAAAAAPAGLDAALNRIQTSLTALHERLAERERSSTSSSTSTPTDFDSPISLLRLTFLRVLVLLKIRSPASQRTLPKLSWYGLFVRLVQSLVRVGRRLMGDLGIVVLLVAVLGRVTGRGFVQADGIGELVAPVVRALGGVKKTREARLVN